MINFIITQKLESYKEHETSLPFFFISSRRLSLKEVKLANELNIRRFYLPPLSEKLEKSFLLKFDMFWEDISKNFNSKHFFWRNVVSSKMQEWEKSISYLILTLFTITKLVSEINCMLIVVCSSIEEEKAWQNWGKLHDWNLQCRKLNVFKYILIKTKQEIKNTSNFIFYSLICLYYKFHSPKYESQSRSGLKSVLIISLFYNTSFSENHIYSDPFFGNLHNYLEKNNINVTYLCHPLGKFRDSLEKVRECKKTRIIVPYTFLSWTRILSIAFRLFLRRLRLSHIEFSGCNFAELIKWNARRFDFFFNFHAEIFYEAINKISEKDKHDKLIHIYEGNVFERASIQSFRKNNNERIIGYSHGVIYPLNLKLRLTKNETNIRPMPDLILGTGPLYREILAEVGGYDLNYIKASCSLRQIPYLKTSIADNKDERNILIALDGVISCVSVLDWILENYSIFNDYKVFIRTHPNVPMPTILKMCVNPWPKDNFYHSKNSLKEDFEKCFCVIYRQTSVGLQALMNGIPAIHLRIDAPLKCDPLIYFSYKHWHVENHIDLTKAIDEINALTLIQKSHMAKAAKSYADRYFALPENIKKDLFLD